MVPFFIFDPESESFSTQRSATQVFSVISIITGSEAFVMKSALPARKDSRIADYGKSPLSRLLILND